MAESEVNVINHLLDVEKRASGLTSDAQAEADKRIAAYRAEAESDYKKQHDEISAQFESDYQAQTKAIDEKHAEEIAAYRSEIQNTTQDTGAFNKLLDTLLAVH